jgi:hypothetical protein
MQRTGIGGSKLTMMKKLKRLSGTMSHLSLECNS